MLKLDSFLAQLMRDKLSPRHSTFVMLMPLEKSVIRFLSITIIKLKKTRKYCSGSNNK